MENNIFETLNKIPPQNFYPYISHIRFPFYKKLKQGLRIDFPYPITAIIGVNGSSKSSILRAIYGSPGWNSIGSYWFESNMDKYYDEDGNKKPKSSFVYGYYNEEANTDVEIRKARVRKKDDPDYWEPTRPVGDMAVMPEIENNENFKGRSKTRWSTMKKNVIYLDFRHEAISAFDKYFYNGNEDLKQKKTFIRSRSKYIREIIDTKKHSYVWYKKNRVKNNKILDAKMIDKISNIIGKKYSSIQVIEHSLYTKFMEKTIFVSSNNMEYSEAFAGSGEFAVISLVKSVMEAPEKSLIILDEPESSIHPAAQKNLMLFLAEQVKLHKHQIIFATHSPTLIENLPSKAINVLYELQDGTIDLLPNVSPERAFQHIGASFDKKTIIVEDKLSQRIVEKILKRNDMEELFDVKTSPGGESEIKRISIVSNAIFQDATNVLYLLDGDQRRDHQNPKDIPESKNSELDKIIKSQTNCDISTFQSSDNQKEKVQNQRKYLDFYYKYVKYLPSDTPEILIWNNMKEEDKQGINNTNVKKCFEQLSQNIFGETTADYIFKTQELCLNKIDIHNNAFQELLNTIKTVFNNPC